MVRTADGAAVLAASVVALANTLELEPVVEGVETQEQVDALRALGPPVVR